MRAMMELLRVLVLMVVLGSVLQFVLNGLYGVMGAGADVYGLAPVGSLLIVFVLYRNWLQFSGWYKQGRQKLSPRLTGLLLGAACALFVVAPLLG